MITFEYNGKIYTPSNLEKKLKKLGTTLDKVKILKDTADVELPKNEEVLTYQQANNIILDIWQDEKNNFLISIQNNKYIPSNFKLLGTTLNPQSQKIETIFETEKRLGIFYSNK